MKLRIIPIIALFAFLAFAAQAQDYERLGRAAEEVKDSAESVSKTAANAFRKGGENSSDAIEQAFLAEQVLASARYMEKIVKDKYGIGDLRLAANVLSELTIGFPSGGQWTALKDKIDSLVFELGRGADVPFTNEEKVPVPDGEVADDKILGMFFWNGEVDAEVQLTVKGTVIASRTTSGRQLEDGKYSFTSALPRESGLLVGVRMTEGRGEATVIQQPNPANDFSAVVRIRDGAGGARPYSLEIYWYRGN